MNKIADEIANITRDGVGKVALKAAEIMQAQSDALVDKEYGLLIDQIRAIAPHSFSTDIIVLNDGCQTALLSDWFKMDLRYLGVVHVTPMVIIVLMPGPIY